VGEGKKFAITATLIISVNSGISLVYAEDTPTNLVDARAGRTEYSPYLNDTYPDNVYYGDTHLHTSYSTDAGFFGNRLS
jgi:hypothetical protein